MSRIALHNQDFLLVLRRLRDDDAKRIGHKRMSPKLEVVSGRAFETDAIHRRDVDAVRDGVRALDRLPRRELGGAMLGLLVRVPANGGGIKQHVSALHRRQPRRLGIPLVPTDQHADAPERRVEIAEAQIARSEIELLVVQRIVRDVHLAVQAQQRAVGVQHGSGVVIEPGGAPLEQTGNNDGPGFFGDAADHARWTDPESARRGRIVPRLPCGKNTASETALADRRFERHARRPRECGRRPFQDSPPGLLNRPSARGQSGTSVA